MWENSHLVSMEGTFVPTMSSFKGKSFSKFTQLSENMLYFCENFYFFLFGKI